jgi:hypothetical protein
MQRQRDKEPFLGNAAATNPDATIEVLLETVFLLGPCKWKFIWKGAAVQRGLEPGSRTIVIDRSRYQ